MGINTHSLGNKDRLEKSKAIHFKREKYRNIQTLSYNVKAKQTYA